MITFGLISIPSCYYYFYIKKYDIIDFYERAYRLRNNKYQQRIDKISITSSFIGLLIFIPKGLPFYGISIGYFAGLNMAMIINYFIYKNEQKKIIKEQYEMFGFD